MPVFLGTGGDCSTQQLFLFNVMTLSVLINYVFSLCDQHSLLLCQPEGSFEIALAGKNPLLPEIELKVDCLSLSI